MLPVESQAFLPQLRRALVIALIVGHQRKMIEQEGVILPVADFLRVVQALVEQPGGLPEIAAPERDDSQTTERGGYPGFVAQLVEERQAFLQKLRRARVIALEPGEIREGTERT